MGAHRSGRLGRADDQFVICSRGHLIVGFGPLRVGRNHCELPRKARWSTCDSPSGGIRLRARNASRTLESIDKT